MLDANIDGHDVQVRFVVPLEQSTLRAGTTRAARVRELIGERFGNDAARKVAWTAPVEMNDAAVSPHQHAQAGTAPVVLSGREALLGREQCRHDRAEWHVQHGRRGVPQYWRLACPACLRDQVTTVPLHRRRVGGALEYLDTDMYLSETRAQAAFFGEHLPEHITLDQLVERDAHLSVEPTDYAQGQVVSQVRKRRGLAGVDPHRRRPDNLRRL